MWFRLCLFFPGVSYRDHFIRGVPPGSIGCAAKSGWMNEELFTVYMKHLTRETSCSKEHKILLMFDNHDAHISFEAADLAKDNGIVMVTIPPHTLHRLQSLDRSVYGPFKKAYSRAMDVWMLLNLGKTVIIYETASVVNDVHVVVMTPANVLSVFLRHRHYPIQQGPLHIFRFFTSHSNWSRDGCWSQLRFNSWTKWRSQFQRWRSVG